MVNIWLSVFILMSLSLGVGAVCPAPALPAGMSRTPVTADNAGVADGDTLAYTCLTDYTAEGSDETLTCNTDTWSADISLVCKGCAAPALDSTMERSPTKADGDIVADGDTLVYTCKTGHTPSVASQTITCVTNTWDSAVTLTCGCAAPALPAGMTRTPETAEGAVIADGDTLEYTCHGDYTAVGSDQTITCGTGSWTPDITLVCKGCAAPVLPVGMSRTPTTADGAVIADTDTIVYTCLSGYAASGADQTIICGTNTWSPALTLTCSGRCTVPAQPTGMTSSTAVGAGVLADVTITYTCASGYTSNSASGVSTCPASGSTDMTTPALVCSGRCTVPARPTGMTSTSAVGDPVLADGTITYTCAAGYTSNSASGLSTCPATGSTDMTKPALVCSDAPINMGFGLYVAVVAIFAHVLSTRV
ncbi:hypothetical protein ScPMuIL_002870 [Solemya velum]